MIDKAVHNGALDDRLFGHVRFWCGDGRFIVFDLISGQKLWTTRPCEALEFTEQFATSPSGHQFATINADVVTLSRLGRQADVKTIDPSLAKARLTKHFKTEEDLTPNPDGLIIAKLDKDQGVRSAIRFNEEADLFKLPSWSTEPTKPFTVETVVNLKPISGQYYSPLVCHSLFTLRRHYTNHLQFAVNADGLPNHDTEWHNASVDSFPMNQWIHIAATWDGKRSRLYIDGNQKDIQLFSGTPSAETLADQFRVGGSWDDPIRGAMAALRISNGVTYESNFEPKFSLTSDDSTVVLLQMSEGSGETIRDASGNGFDAKVRESQWVLGPEISPLATALLPPPPVFDRPVAGMIQGSIGVATQRVGLRLNQTESNVGSGVVKLTETDPVTIECIAKFTDKPHGYYGFVMHSSLSMQLTPTGSLDLTKHALRDGKTVYRGVDAPAPRNKWCHVAGCWDGKGTMTLFVDGTKVNAQRIQLGLQSKLDNNLWVGNTFHRKEKGEFAMIDAFKMSSEVGYVENFTPPTALTTDRQTLVLHQFNEGSGLKTADSASQLRDVKVYSPVWFTESADQTGDVEAMKIQTGGTP